MSATASVSAATPLFKTRTVLHDSVNLVQYDLAGFNKQGFIIGTKSAGYEQFLYRDGNYTALSSQSLQFGSSMNAYDLSDADANGVMRIGGRVSYADGYAPNGTPIYARGLMITATTNGVVTSVVSLPNYIIPPDAVGHANEETPSGYALGINSSGLAGGFPHELWTTTGNAAAIGNCAEIGDIDNDGHFVKRGMEFHHFDPDNYYGEAIGPSDIPVPGLPGEPNGANTHLAQINNGRGAGVDYDSATFTPRAVAWAFGDSYAQLLPAPAGSITVNAQATSINAIGDVVGWGQYTNKTAGLFRAYVLWKNRGDHYDGYFVKDLVVDQLTLTDDHTKIFINDMGQIALSESSGFSVYILDPVGGRITVDAPSSYLENAGPANIKLKLERAENYTGPVSVHYSTADGSALAGVRYTAVNGTVSWGSFDSSDKFVSVPLIDDNVGQQYEYFYLNLDNFVGAGSAATNQFVSIQDDSGIFTWSSGAYKIADNWTNVTLTMQRLSGVDGAVSLSFGTYDISAVAGTDYVATNGTVSWAAGDATSRTIKVPIMNRGAGFTNVSFGVYAYISSADSGCATVAEPSQPEVTIVRPGHPLPSLLTQFAKTNSNTLQFGFDATVGGKLLIQSTTNLADPNSWQTVLTLTNVTGSVNVNDFVVTVKGKFYRVQSQ